MYKQKTFFFFFFWVYAKAEFQLHNPTYFFRDIGNMTSKNEIIRRLTGLHENGE